MTLIKLKEREGDPQSVVNQLRALMEHFSRLVEDARLVKRFWGEVGGDGRGLDGRGEDKRTHEKGKKYVEYVNK